MTARVPLAVLGGWALVVGCSNGSDGAGETPETPEDTLVELPLPAECDVPLPETALKPDVDCSTPCALESQLFGNMRAAGNTVYYREAGTMFAADVPGGEPRRLFSFAEWGTPEELEGRAPYQFANTWVDESTITGAYRGVLYRAPREGGEPVVVSETLPPLEGDPLFERAVRAGDFLYSVIGEGASATLFRMPWQGGERETIRELPGWSIIDELVAGKSALYYRSSNSNQTWSFPYDGGEPQLIASDPVDRLLGAEERPYLLSRADDDDRDALYLGPSILHSGLEDGDPTAQLTLPRGYFSGLFATSHNIAGDPQIVRYDDALYFIAFGRYALPDDRRAHERPVLVRVTPDLDSLEVVRCIPPPPFDPLVPGGGQEKYEIQGITASAAGIFVLRETAFAAAGDGSVRPHAVRVWP